MAFLWSKYSDFANFLFSQRDKIINDSQKLVDEETILRTSISRAYYGAFCHARVYAKINLGFQITGDPTDHGKLRDCFRSCRLFQVADSLQRLRQWRNDCDYHEDKQISSENALSAPKSAKTIIDKLNR